MELKDLQHQMELKDAQHQMAMKDAEHKLEISAMKVELLEMKLAASEKNNHL